MSLKMFRVMFPYFSDTKLPVDIADLVEKKAFDGLTGSASAGAGWSRIVGDVRVVVSDGRVLLRYRSSERTANAVAVAGLVEERIQAAIEAGREVTEQVQFEMTEQARNEVIKFAPVKDWTAFILLSPTENLLLVSGTNAKKCETALSMLRHTLDGLAAIPVGFGFGGMESGILTTHLSHPAGSPNPYPLPPELTISPFGKTVATGSDSSLKLTFDGVRNDTPEAKSLFEGMKVRTAEMSLVERPGDGQIKNLADFVLHLPEGGNLHFKGYDYDSDESGDEEAEDAQHVYAVEMLLVANYTRRILRNLSVFFGVAGLDELHVSEPEADEEEQE